MEFDLVDRVEQAWLEGGKRRDIDYVWLAHGKYIRDNPDFHAEIPSTPNHAPGPGLGETREIIARFYSRYIVDEENAVSASKCCVTAGCRDGVEAALRYFKRENDRNILFLVPTFQPLIDIGKRIFKPWRIFYLDHFNEPWEKTLRNIEETCEKNRIGCIVITNPNNPAGIMYPEAFVEGLGKLGNENKIWIIEDGAYFLHYAKKGQTTILDHCRYAVSLITSLKLLLGRHKIGGAVMAGALDAGAFSEFTQKVPHHHQVWFENLLKRVAFENPRLLKNHLAGMFDMSEAVTAVFTKNGFVPLYGSLRDGRVETSIGPVISFTYRSKNGEPVPPETLYTILKSHFVLTTPLAQGIRINSRGITEAGKRLLTEKMEGVRTELEENLNSVSQNG